MYGMDGGKIREWSENDWKKRRLGEREGCIHADFHSWLLLRTTVVLTVKRGGKGPIMAV